MQPSSSLEGSSEGIESASTSVRSLGIPNQAVASQQVEISDSQHQQALLFNQADQNQPIMDELFDNMLSISSWSDVGTMRSNWEYTTSSGNGLDDLLQSNQKPFNATSLLARALDTHSTNAQNKGTTNGIENTQIMGGLGFHSDDPMLSSQLSGIQLLASPPISQFNNQQASLQNCGIMSNQDADTAPSGPQDARPELGLNHDSTNSLLVSAPSVSGFASIGDSCAAPPLGKPGGGVAEGSTCQQVALDSSSTLATNWRQSYMSGISSIPLCLGQVKQETFLPREMPSHDLHLLGRKDAEEKLLRERLTPINRDSSQGGLFNVYGGSHLNQVQMPRTGQVSIHQGNPASSQGPQSGRVTVQAYRNQTTMSQPQPMNPMPGPARPRVRARRGQATDPHSIAERLRRERIAERMKALQELVPNANKTDKASMLDEIIEYVKFLQLQVKVLSMSRLGGAGAVPPLVSDVTAEGHGGYLSSSVGRNPGATGPGNDLAFTERQVARLMEEDMGSAMQFLQSKGFCLMPISLASAISSTKGSAALQSIGSGDKQLTETSTIVSSTPMVVNAQVSSISANGVGNGSENGNGKTTIIGATKDSKDLDKVNESRQLVKSPKSIQKSNDDSSRRPQ